VLIFYHLDYVPQAIERQAQNRARALRTGLLRQSSTLIATPTGALYWAQQARLARQSSSTTSDSGSRGEYARVSQDEPVSAGAVVTSQHAARADSNAPLERSHSA